MIRLMEERDIPQVAELERLCFSTPWSENSLKESLVRPEYLFLVEETDGKESDFRKCISEHCMVLPAVSVVVFSADIVRHGGSFYYWTV